jgi:hypothetical protein
MADLPLSSKVTSALANFIVEGEFVDKTTDLH